MSNRLLLSERPGVRTEVEFQNDGTFLIHQTADDLDPVLDINKAMYTHNDGYSPSRELRRVAFIPDIIINKWLVEEGWNALDPECDDKLTRKLNDSEWLYLRTAPGCI